jgi:hypothetical protein
MTATMTIASRACLLVGLVAGAACSSGEDGTSTAGYTLIDDMEDGNRIAWSPPVGAKPGRWAAWIDCTQAERIVPPPYFVDQNASPHAALEEPSETFAGVASTGAVRLRTTTPIVGVWGASLEIFLASDTDNPPPLLNDAGGPPWGTPCRQGTNRDLPGPTVDLTPYSGITFWAKSTAGSRRLRVELHDRNTDPRGGVCNVVDEANCNNGFATFVALTDSFARYTIDFSTLAQDPLWGYRPDPSVPDLARAYLLNFQFDAALCDYGASMCPGGEPLPLSFDFWLDDLYFVKRQR